MSKQKIERTDPELTEDLVSRFDAGGEMTKTLAAFRAVSKSMLGRGMIRLLGVDPKEIGDLVAQHDELLRQATESVRLFVPLGWAPSGCTPQSVYSDAIRVLKETGSIYEAEQVLIRGWNDGDYLRLFVKRLRTFGRDHLPLASLFHARADKVDKAWTHHSNGAYEASVPIVLQQIDGMVWDITDGKAGFFSGSGDHLVDHETIAGIPEGLRPLHMMFGRDMRRSGMTGALARHAILHGRELAYDTELNSTKCFVLLLAVMEWAQPKAAALAERLEAEREAKYAGSTQIDDDGRRLDTRGFRAARKVLDDLMFTQVLFFGDHGRYATKDELLSGKRGNRIGAHPIELLLAQDGQEYWAWAVTPSGFCFGVANRSGGPLEWKYAGDSPPAGSIEVDDWRRDDIDPNWFFI